MDKRKDITSMKKIKVNLHRIISLIIIISMLATEANITAYAQEIPPEGSAVSEETVVFPEEGESPAYLNGSDISINANNSLGGLFSEKLQAAVEEEQSGQQNGYGISDIEISDGTAYVKLHATDDCSVVIAIY